MSLYLRGLRIPLGWEIHSQAAADLPRQPMETIPSLLQHHCPGDFSALLQLGLQDPGIHLPCSTAPSSLLDSTLNHLCLPCAALFSSPWKIQNGIFHGEEKNGLEGTLEVILFHPPCSTLILCLISSPFISSCTSDWKFPRMQKKSLLFDPALLTVAFQVESHLSSLFIRVVHHCHARTSFYSFKTHTNGSADYFP